MIRTELSAESGRPLSGGGRSEKQTRGRGVAGPREEGGAAGGRRGLERKAGPREVGGAEEASQGPH